MDIRIFAPNIGCTLCITKDFGTNSGVYVAWALALKTCGYYHDTMERHKSYWGPNYTKPAFYCSTSDWWKH